MHICVKEGLLSSIFPRYLPSSLLLLTKQEQDKLGHNNKMSSKLLSLQVYKFGKVPPQQNDFDFHSFITKKIKFKAL